MEQALRSELTELIGLIYERGWAPGTGGNFSRVLSVDPLRLLITPSGVDKGSVKPEDLLVVDEMAQVVQGAQKPSAETWLHIPIVEECGAKVIVHTHSIWNTLASLTPGSLFTINGLEMLKGLTGVATHEHTESVPILENSQDVPALAETLRKVLRSMPDAHAVLLRGHGLYTWGCDIFEAKRHLEILEFLFEVTIRSRTLEP
ncbi:MAG: methylthioribulose 1-phosphate dehydratase [Armatimonadetes bacterium]|nr:methylthioribulose 1-phosphate dehydratase [Armatimonadota bacterium]